MTSVRHVARHLDNQPTHSEPALSSVDELKLSMNAETPSQKLSQREIDATESRTGTEFQIWLSLPFHNLPVALNSGYERSTQSSS